MRVVKALAGVIAALVVLFFAVGGCLPDRVAIDRGIHVARSPAEVHAVLDGFGRFNEWSPWSEWGPQARHEFSCPPTGGGASLRWVGKDTVGSGRRRIVECVASERVVAAIEFDGPGEVAARRLLWPRDGGTDVPWGFQADDASGLAGRWHGLVRLGALLESGAGLAASVMADGEEIGHMPLMRLDASDTAPATLVTPRVVAVG